MLSGPPPAWPGRPAQMIAVSGCRPLGAAGWSSGVMISPIYPWCSIVPYVRQSDLEARAGADGVARAIGYRVRQGRNGRGWTLDQLAERCGVSRRMLVSIEQGSANPSIATLLLISDALGIGLPALVDMDRSPGLRVPRAGTAPVPCRGTRGGPAGLVAGPDP